MTGNAPPSTSSRYRSSLVVVLVASCSIAFASGCRRQSEGEGGGPGEPKAGTTTYRVGVIPKGTTHVFWLSIHAGALLGAKAIEEETGDKVEVLWQGPPTESEREKQRQILETMTGSNVNGIVFAPIDDHAMVGPVDAAMAAGKPVVIIDSGLDSDNYVSFVATDNYKGGELAAKRLGQLLGGKGKALLLRYQEGSASTTKREQGFLDVMQRDFPEIELLPPNFEQYAGATAGEAQDAAETLLNTYRDLDGIFCPNESSCTGMIEALRQSGRAGKLKFVGFDANEKLVDALEKDEMHGLILQSPVRMGKIGVETLVKKLRGETVEKRIDTGVFLVTKENMKEREFAELLAPDLSILEK